MKSFLIDKIGLGYTRESSSAINVSKEVKFVKAKKPIVVSPTVEKVKEEKKKNVADQRVLNKPRNQSVVKLEAKGKSLPRSQRGSRTNHVYHKLRALNNARDQRSRGPRDGKKN